MLTHPKNIFSLLTLLTLTTPTLAAHTPETGSQNVCIGPFLLCSTALCTNIPGNTTHATCSCAGPYNGLNTGPPTCVARTNSFLSTFSLANPYSPEHDVPQPHLPIHFTTSTNEPQNASETEPPLYAFPCTGSNAAPWAQCNGAPCALSPTGITCTCPIEASSDNFYYGPECPADEAGVRMLCLKLRSSAVLPAGANVSTLPERLVSGTLGGFYGVPPKVRRCVVAG